MTICRINCLEILVAADLFLDYVPFLSIVSNIVDLVAKQAISLAVALRLLEQSTVDNNLYLRHLEAKTTDECLTCAIPVFGGLLRDWTWFRDKKKLLIANKKEYYEKMSYGLCLNKTFMEKVAACCPSAAQYAASEVKVERILKGKTTFFPASENEISYEGNVIIRPSFENWNFFKNNTFFGSSFKEAVLKELDLDKQIARARRLSASLKDPDDTDGIDFIVLNTKIKAVTLALNLGNWRDVRSVVLWGDAGVRTHEAFLNAKMISQEKYDRDTEKHKALLAPEKFSCIMEALRSQYQSDKVEIEGIFEKIESDLIL